MSCCSGGNCGGCKGITAVVTLLLTVVAIASLLGVYNTHMTAEGWMFGTLNGSVAIIAFTAAIMCWIKLVKKMCPCGKSGMCPGCGHNPCTCK
jgi:ABC-type nickel/cobalt efflux system permease component RcnA